MTKTFSLLRKKPRFRLNYRPPPSPSARRDRRALPLAKGLVTPPPPSYQKLLSFFPGIRNQEQEGACTGFASAGWRETAHGSATGTMLPFRLSPAYVYGKARIAMGTFPADSGSTISDEFGALQEWGICPEQDLPYDADPAEAPTAICDGAAVPFRIGGPCDVGMDDASIKAVLAAGQPIAISMPVYESFEDVGQDGLLSIPNPSTEAFLGGHGILILAYDEKGMTGANQWGTTWGDQGFFHMPWGYQSIWWEAKTAPLAA